MQIKIRKRNIKWILLIIATILVVLYISLFNQSEEGKTLNAIRNSKAGAASGQMSPADAEALVIKEAKGGLVPDSAPQEYKRDETRFDIVRKVRIALADYYDSHNSYPISLDNILPIDGNYVKDFNYSSANKDGYNLIVKFETSEAVLVGANADNENKNVYDLKSNTVIFTQKSGNFFYFTAATAK